MSWFWNPIVILLLVYLGSLLFFAWMYRLW